MRLRVLTLNSGAWRNLLVVGSSPTVPTFKTYHNAGKGYTATESFLLKINKLNFSTPAGNDISYQLET